VYNSVTTLDSEAVKTSGDQTIAGVKTFSSFPITPSSAPTTDYQVANKKYVDDNGGTDYDPDLMIGSANKAFVPCLFMNASVDDWRNDGAGVSSGQSGTDGYLVYQLPLPTNRGGLKLYGTQVRITTKKADSNNYITQEYVFANTDSSATAVQSSLTDINTATTTTRAFTTNPTDLSSYKTLTVFMECIVAAWSPPSSSPFRIYGVEIECYYA
jgi:hypothetical protein